MYFATWHISISPSDFQVFFFFTLFCFAFATRSSAKETSGEDVIAHKEAAQEDLEAEGSVLSYRFPFLHALLIIVLFNRSSGLTNECPSISLLPLICVHWQLKSVSSWG